MSELENLFHARSPSIKLEFRIPGSIIVFEGLDCFTPPYFLLDMRFAIVETLLYEKNYLLVDMLGGVRISYCALSVEWTTTRLHLAICFRASAKRTWLAAHILPSRF